MNSIKAESLEEAFSLSIPAAQVADFFSAIGWSLPNRPITPPTLATVFRQGEFALLQKLQISLRNVLHGEQKYRLLKPLLPDQTYHGKTTIKSHHEKSNATGSTKFYVFQTDLFDSAENRCVECLSTIVVREKK